jgi:hypothetical protein
MTEIHREMHLVEELKINMLIENDILESEEIIINVQQKKVTIRNCENLVIDVKIHQRESFVRRNVISQFVNIILSDSYAKISYKMKDLSTNQDFIFESFSEVSIFIYAHVINARTIDVIVRNESAKLMKISQNFKLDVAQKMKYDDCFYVSHDHHLALQVSKKNQIIEALKVESIVESRSRVSTKNSKMQISMNQIDEKFEEKIFFDVIVYEDDNEKQKFDKLINEFSEI